MIDLVDLQRFLAVQEYGTLTAAAKVLHISQPSLSRSMQRLEDELGCTLFFRTRNSVELNEYGLFTAAEAKTLINAAKRMSERIQAHTQSFHVISIGSCAPGPLWICEPELQKAYPEMEVRTECTSTEKLMEGLRSERFQLVITDKPLRESGIATRELLTERLFVSLPPSHPLAEKDAVSLVDLEGENILLFSELGIWDQLLKEKVQGIHLIVQTAMESFVDLVHFSSLPRFDTNLSEGHLEMPAGHIRVPIRDPEASLTFFASSLKKNKWLLDFPINGVPAPSRPAGKKR